MPLYFPKSWHTVVLVRSAVSCTDTDGSADGDIVVQALVGSLPRTSIDGTDQNPAGVVREPTVLVKCEGRRVAAVLRYLVDALSRETEDMSTIVWIAGRCCETCRTDVAVLDGLVCDFTRIARSLESVSQHRLSGVNIGCSQPCGIVPSTPRRDRRLHHWLPIVDESDTAPLNE
jgi:hypothetical protein